MPKWARCNTCGAEAWLDAYVTWGGDIVNTFETATCPYEERDIGHDYTVIDGNPPVED